MTLMNFGNSILPIVVFFILFYALLKKVPIYDSFIVGAKEGLELAVSIFPFLVSMLFATDILLKSELLNHLFLFLKPLFDLVKIPIEILPMALIRPISGNASFAVMIDLIKKYGVDSFLGQVAATLQGATDTTIYVLSLYFGSIGIKKIRYSLVVGLLTDFTALIVSLCLVRLLL